MSRWKRVGLSLLSSIIAELIVGLAISFPGGKHLFFEHIFVFIYFASFLVIPGWLISLPIVLFFETDTRSRLFVLAILGALIGPVVILCIALYAESTKSAPSNGTWSNGSMEFVYIATAISIVATTLYLTSLKLLSPPTPTPSS